MTMRTTPFRQPLHPQIDDDLIERLIRAFYTKVRAEKDLGPIFEGVIGAEWEPHLHKMFDFWSSLTMLTGRYKGQPMVAHLKLKNVTPAHFDIWLSLFRETAIEICGEEIAPIFIEKAERVAESFKLGMFFDPKTADAKEQHP